MATARGVSIAGHGRRLDRLERRGRAPVRDGWMEAVYRCDQEQKAALAVVAFVRSLVGTDRNEVPTPVLPAGEGPTDFAPRPPPRDRRPPETRPSERPASRPDRNAVLTWDEAMRLPAGPSRCR